MSDRTVQQGATWTPTDRRRTRRAALAGGVGTLIEYYDFSLYGYLAVIIAPLFFPSQDPVTSLLSALAVFGTAYLIRPLGGIVFGHVGDRYGRKRALVATLVCMGVGSTLMGLLPTYAQAGVWATVLLVLVRLLQGFSAGGEVGGAATFISESTPRHLKATYGAFTPLGSTGGFALAAAVAGITTGLTTDAQMDSWGWRVPFLLAFPLTLFCLWARARVEETHDATGTHEGHSPVGHVFRRQPRALAQATAISAATNGTAYIGLTYLSIHLIQRLGYEQTPVYWIATAAIGISALCMPLGGLLGDRIGRVRLAEIGFVGYVVLTYPMMALMDDGLAVAALAYLVIMLNTVGAQVGAYTLLPLLFDQRSRYTGVAMGWNLGVIVAGGTAPYLAVWLIERTGNELAPSFFVVVVALVGLAALFSVRRGSLDRVEHVAAPAAARAVERT
ncbi:MFS transporter, MHS family, proline/betaine transporter [Geodermatophilus pulveris]|uniref:Putative proline/betaine transporter n=1 Tax=Geodermatophilus pulveris TaxID=1564159 RepID=A0A239DBF5_9ACTN|nr:MFS transporter [Geodermatophilus pulveris]SNS29640.1 MFS transporter, MHS family, proline/betaine transporter [Geodermatophilus pulveris]